MVSWKEALVLATLFLAVASSSSRRYKLGSRPPEGWVPVLEYPVTLGTTMDATHGTLVPAVSTTGRVGQLPALPEVIQTMPEVIPDVIQNVVPTFSFIPWWVWMLVGLTLSGMLCCICVVGVICVVSQKRDIQCCLCCQSAA